MNTTPKPKSTPSSSVAIAKLRAPVLAFPAACASAKNFRTGMLQLASQLEGFYEAGDEDTLESNVVWTALFSFPALVAPGPPPPKLLSLVLQGQLADEDAVTTLRTLSKICRLLTAYEPEGFAAALWRATLLAIYRMVGLFVLIDDDRGLDHCFQLLDTAEAMAGRFNQMGVGA